MKNSAKIFLLLSVFAVSAFAYNPYSYDPYTCSLQNLFKPNSCRPNLVPNDAYRCWALPYTRVGGKPVCVKYY